MSTITTSPSATAGLVSPSSKPSPISAQSINPVVSFIIGFFIITMASLLNAGGLNLTKLDHVRTMSLPKSERRKDFLRPLWVLGMLLYVLSQLIGSSLALEYMRAEYVAPLGSSSLVFNFMFASILISTPITRMDIYGTAVVIVGVIGIVAFGSINSGLKEYFSLALLSHLWARPGWIGYFILITSAIVIQYISNTQLEAVYHARSEIAFPSNSNTGMRSSRRTSSGRVKMAWTRLSEAWGRGQNALQGLMERWTENKGDKTVAWILGIGWACNGGAMAGGSLVFAKATVKLISGALNHTNTGNQFIHPAAFFTFLLLALSAVFQIICLNRGLKIYDSTLVVPTFYAVYTAMGWLNSLVFMDEVDSYSNWTLFAIFVSICILIFGVVLLTSKKPEPSVSVQSNDRRAPVIGSVPRNTRARLGRKDRSRAGQSVSSSSPILGDDEDDLELGGDGENDALRPHREEEEHQMWQVGEEDEESETGDDNRDEQTTHGESRHTASSTGGADSQERQHVHDGDDEFGDWEDGGKIPESR